MAAFAMFNVPPQRKERVFRSKEGLSLDFSDRELRERYRFGREGILYISQMLRNDLKRETNRNHALSVEQQVMVTLRFLASGSFLQVIGDTLGLDKGTVSRVITTTTEALCRKLDEFVKWPVGEEQRRKTKGDFYRVGGFPNVIGAVDGTHVKIQAPIEDEPAYVNRKRFHSTNVQGVCDGEGKFTNLNASWPGSVHDAHIFRTSQVCAYMERQNWEDGVLLGDSGYACRPFMMTPYLNPGDERKTRFNRHHTRTRCLIERTFGRWKRRFHILHSEIRMKPEKACNIIIACGVLHNIACLLNEPEVNADDQAPVDDQPVDNDYNGVQDGRRIRDHITNTFFA